MSPDEEQPETDQAAPAADGHDWYILQTYTGYEEKAKRALEERMRAEELDEDFDEVYIPTETVTEVTRGGDRKEKERKFYKGYIFVKMDLNERTWHVVKETPKIVGFPGKQSNPTPVPPEEVKGIAQRIEEGSLQAEPLHDFQKGDKVRITEGNFQDFTGTVEEVDEEQERLQVFVEIFGRPTSVEFDFNQVEKED
ncbi:MAG: transcription termination/antitermination protein NusG [Bradymonadaceae bacterium]